MPTNLIGLLLPCFTWMLGDEPVISLLKGRRLMLTSRNTIRCSDDWSWKESASEACSAISAMEFFHDYEFSQNIFWQRRPFS